MCTTFVNSNMADERSAFIRLRNVDTSFQNRSDSVFGRLSNLEPTTENSRTQTREEIATKQQNAKSTRLPSTVPQHILSPEKWTKYSLEDDGSEAFRGLNEHNLNKYAAHTFLADLKKRKSVEISNDNSLNPRRISEENLKPEIASMTTVQAPDTKTGHVKSDIGEASQQTSVGNKERVDVLKSDNDSKVLFKKPEVKEDMTSPSHGAVWKEGTYVMPEYVVGSAPSKGKPKLERSSGVKGLAGNDVVNLEHLGDECEEDFTGGDITSVMEEEKTAKQKRKRVFRKRKVEDEGRDDACENKSD